MTICTTPRCGWRGRLAPRNKSNAFIPCVRFYDVERKIQFIDTPGLDDQILSPNLLDFTKGERTQDRHQDLKEHFLDPVVQEFLDTIEQEKKEVTALDTKIITHR